MAKLITKQNTDFEMITVIQGDYQVSDDPNVILTTILGSCISVCLYDPAMRVGGLNHFLLPGFCDSSSGTMSCGLNMMELLINGLLRKGASKNRLQAKMFGGADMLNGLSQNVGTKNVEFTREFFAHEGIPCRSESVGGVLGRRIKFRPTTGEVKQRLISKTETMAIEKQVIKVAKISLPDVSELELF